MENSLWYCQTSKIHEESNTNKVYNNKGFKFCMVLVDGQFKHTQQIMDKKGTIVNICAADKHKLKIDETHVQ